MFNKLEFFIAYRYLRSKRKESFISITALFSFFGIMIGVATLIIVMSVMNGFRYELVNRIIGINSHLTIYSRSSSISDYENIVREILKIEDVRQANSIVEAQAMLSSSKKAIGGLVKGIKLEDLQQKELIAKNITRGNINDLSNKDGVIIGSALAQNLGLKIGDKIKIISAKINNTIIGVIPRSKDYKVVGIFESGMYEYDSATVFMNFKMAQTHFQVYEKASAIEIFVNDAINLDLIKSEVFKIMANSQDDDLYFVDWEQSNASFIEALKVERTVMFMILTLIILVAAFNIISTMIMLVKEKNKNIAILRSFGMTKGAIVRIFLICGSSIGFLGTLFGLVIGVLFSMNINGIKRFLENLTDTTLFNPTIYFLSNLPSKIFASDVIMIVGMSIIISILATLYPAYRAGKSNPVEILRYE